MPYPDNCIKGIPNANCLLDDGAIASLTLFAFHGDRSRSDGWIEESINWMDDEHAIDATLAQTKDGDFQLKVGVALIPRSELDKLKKRTGTGSFDYERARLPDNDYHGNLLLKEDVEKTLKTMIRSALALAAEIIPRAESQESV